MGFFSHLLIGRAMGEEEGYPANFSFWFDKITACINVCFFRPRMYQLGGQHSDNDEALF